MRNLDILIVEDEPRQREMLMDFLAKEGHGVSGAEDGPGALQLLRQNPFDLALVDYKLPKMNGLELLKEAKRFNPELDILMITAYGTVDTAVEAMKAGAMDYITKPIDLEQLLILIQRIAERRLLLRENEILRQRLEGQGVSQDDIVYLSPKMAELINLAGRVAPSKASVLIQGESGTGKELLARLIHGLGSRSKNSMVTVNCSALPESLLESELFGHERGAFTGAVKRRIGRFEEADGGTLFLDEIGELTPSSQVKLLRFLQEGDFQRVGGNKTLNSDVRIISATNQDLDQMVKRGEFREDLYYRLNVVMMEVPPLRTRREDIRPLIDHFLHRFSRENRKRIEGFTREAITGLLRYDYPGNVRELENIVERAVVVTRGPWITTEDLPFGPNQTKTLVQQEEGGGSLRQSLEALELRLIREALEGTGGNQTRAADVLGISERMLRYKLKKYGLK